MIISNMGTRRRAHRRGCAKAPRGSLHRALDALVVVARDAQRREVAHWLQEHHDGARVLAESPIVAQCVGKGDADGVGGHVACDERPERGALDAAHVGQEQRGDEHERRPKQPRPRCSRNRRGRRGCPSPATARRQRPRGPRTGLWEDESLHSSSPADPP